MGYIGVRLLTSWDILVDFKMKLKNQLDKVRLSCFNLKHEKTSTYRCGDDFLHSTKTRGLLGFNELVVCAMIF